MSAIARALPSAERLEGNERSRRAPQERGARETFVRDLLDAQRRSDGASRRAAKEPLPQRNDEYDSGSARSARDEVDAAEGLAPAETATSEETARSRSADAVTEASATLGPSDERGEMAPSDDARPRKGEVVVGPWLARRVGAQRAPKRSANGPKMAPAGKATAGKGQASKAMPSARADASRLASRLDAQLRPTGAEAKAGSTEGAQPNPHGAQVTKASPSEPAESAPSTLEGAGAEATSSDGTHERKAGSEATRASHAAHAKATDAAWTSMRFVGVLGSRSRLRPKALPKPIAPDALHAAFRGVPLARTNASLATQRVVSTPSARDVQRWGPELQMRVNANGGDAAMEVELDSGERARISLRVRDGVAHIRLSGSASDAQLDDVMREVSRIVEEAGLETGSMAFGTRDSAGEGAQQDGDTGPTPRGREADASASEPLARPTRVTSGLIDLVV